MPYKARYHILNRDGEVEESGFSVSRVSDVSFHPGIIKVISHNSHGIESTLLIPVHRLVGEILIESE